MNAVFVDTAGWMVLADAADPLHAESRATRDAGLEAGLKSRRPGLQAYRTAALGAPKEILAASCAWNGGPASVNCPNDVIVQG